MNTRSPIACCIVLSLCACFGSGDGSTGSERSAIIGGGSDDLDDFVVAVDIAPSLLCSGTLIAPNLVLTARHCVSETDATFACAKDADLAVNRVHSNRPSTDFTITNAASSTGSPSWRAAKVIYPDDATCTSSFDVACSLCGWDLALIELAPNGGPWPSHWVAPSPTPAESNLYMAEPPPLGYRAIGFGCQEPMTKGCFPTGERMQIPIDVGARESYHRYVAVGRVCNGDSGSPLYDPARALIYGTLSQADEPGAWSPDGCTSGTYTELDVHYAWLQREVMLAATDGGYAPAAWATTPLADAGADGASDAAIDATTDSSIDAVIDASHDAHADARTLDAALDAPFADAPFADAIEDDANGGAHDDAGGGCATSPSRSPSRAFTLAIITIAAIGASRRRFRETRQRMKEA